jgi:hypothetical protein
MLTMTRTDRPFLAAVILHGARRSWLTSDE